MRALTGYAIGGVPPFGHATALATIMDAGPFTHDVTSRRRHPLAVFETTPKALAAATGARIHRVTWTPPPARFAGKDRPWVVSPNSCPISVAARW